MLCMLIPKFTMLGVSMHKVTYARHSLCLVEDQQTPYPTSGRSEASHHPNFSFSVIISASSISSFSSSGASVLLLVVVDSFSVSS